MLPLPLNSHVDVLSLLPHYTALTYLTAACMRLSSLLPPSSHITLHSTRISYVLLARASNSWVLYLSRIVGGVQPSFVRVYHSLGGFVIQYMPFYFLFRVSKIHFGICIVLNMQCANLLPLLT